MLPVNTTITVTVVSSNELLIVEELMLLLV